MALREIRKTTKTTIPYYPKDCHVKPEMDENLYFLFDYMVGDKLYSDNEDGSEPTFFVLADVSKDRKQCLVDRKPARLVHRTKSGYAYYKGNWDAPSLGLYPMPMDAVQNMLLVQQFVPVIVKTKQSL